MVAYRKETEQEFFHTFEQYDNQGIDVFLEHARSYLNKERTIPVCKPNVLEGQQQVFFTYSNEMLEQFLNNIRSVNKPHDVAMRYGFRGYSSGKKNGIFNLRKQHDKGLHRATSRYLNDCVEQVMRDLNIQKDYLDKLLPVKIVCHQPSGSRVVGAYKPKTNRIIFLGFGQY